MFPVFQRYAPGGGGNYVFFIFLNHSLFKARRIINPEPKHMIELEKFDVIVAGHSLFPPAFDGRRPGRVYYGNPVGVAVLKHSPESLFAGQFFHKLLFKMLANDLTVPSRRTWDIDLIL